VAPSVVSAAWDRRATASPLKEAAFWEPLPGGRARCLTCPNACERGEGGVTLCKTRVCRDGKLYSMTYAKPCVIFEDPLEKNPLYHVAPGNSAIRRGHRRLQLAAAPTARTGTSRRSGRRRRATWISRPTRW